MTRRPGRKGGTTGRIVFRPALERDARLTWGWVRDPSVWKLSFSQKPIPWACHREWFIRTLHGTGCTYLIAENPPGCPIGQVRFETEGRLREISIVVAKSLRGRGYGPRLLRAAGRRHFRQSAATPLLALVRLDNAGSIRAFLKAGFRIVSMTKRRGRRALRMILSRKDARDAEER